MSWKKIGTATLDMWKLGTLGSLAQQPQTSSKAPDSHAVYQARVRRVHRLEPCMSARSDFRACSVARAFAAGTVLLCRAGCGSSSPSNRYAIAHRHAGVSFLRAGIDRSGRYLAVQRHGGWLGHFNRPTVSKRGSHRLRRSLCRAASALAPIHLPATPCNRAELFPGNSRLDRPRQCLIISKVGG